MKASKFSEAQIAFVLKQADEGNTVAEVCRTAGIGPFQYLLRNYLSGSGSYVLQLAEEICGFDAIRDEAFKAA